MVGAKIEGRSARGSMINKYNQIIEVREVQVNKSMTEDIIVGVIESFKARLEAGSSGCY